MMRRFKNREVDIILYVDSSGELGIEFQNSKAMEAYGLENCTPHDAALTLMRFYGK